MTDDVIIGSRDQNWSKFFSPKFSQIDFRKSRGGIRPHYKGLLHAIRKFSRGGGSVGPRPGLGRVKVDKMIKVIILNFNFYLDTHCSRKCCG